MTELELIEILLESCKDEKDGIIIPNEITLKISELDKFDNRAAESLSNKSANVISRSFGNKKGIYRKDDFKKSLIQYSITDDYITFFPSVLKAYSNEQ